MDFALNMTEQIGAIVTGGDFQGISVVRSLSRRNIPVLLLDHDFCIGRVSKFCKKFIRSPHPSNEEIYLNFLLELGEKENVKGWVIFPNSDETVYILSMYKETLKEYFRIPTPDWDVIRYVYIKSETYKVARLNEIPTPETYEAENLDKLLKLNLKFPLAIKPSIRPHFYNKIKIKGFRVNSKDELINTYQRISQIIPYSEIIVQDFIPGGTKNLYSFCPFFKNGKILAGITGRRVRQHPMDFGHASTYVELVDIPELRNLSEKFLRLINYYGIGEVEFMKDPRDGKYKLLEVNPRVWGWHYIAIAAGLDLPYLLYQDMIGKSFDVPSEVKRIKWFRLITDIPTVFLEVTKRRMKVSEYIASMKGNKVEAVFTWDDPLPFFAEFFLLPYIWKKRSF
jgi:predicted ATP-grasp superfamily ATP-dependent carboligase